MPKPRGPVTLLLTSRRFRRWVAIFAVSLPVIYVASFGPVCWISFRIEEFGGKAIGVVYDPLVRALRLVGMDRFLKLYAEMGVPDPDDRYSFDWGGGRPTWNSRPRRQGTRGNGYQRPSGAAQRLESSRVDEYRVP